MKSNSLLHDPAERRFAALVVFLGLVFLIGGGSRGDIHSLIVLRPISVLVCGAGLVGLTIADTLRYRMVIGIVLGSMALILLHLLPLPPGLWQSLSGRELLAETDRLSGTGDAWRPLSLAPDATWNAFFTMFTPLAALLLIARLGPRHLQRLVPVLLGIGMFSAVLGLLQIIGPPDSRLYFYRIHTDGMAVGLFANRNHAAMLLAVMFPLLTLFASSGKTENSMKIRSWLSITVAITLVPMILATGSRAGLLLSVLAIAGSALFHRRQEGLHRRREAHKASRRPLLLVAAFLAVGGASFLFSRATAINRLFSEGVSEDLRFSIWGPTIDAALEFFPFGSGLGTFVEAFKIGEPDSLMGPSYVNHAHNDFLELFMTGGLPAIALALAGLAVAGRWAWQAWFGVDAYNPRVQLARAGSIIVLTLVLGSIADYPLRVPSLACLLIVGIIWMVPERLGAEPKTR